MKTIKIISYRIDYFDKIYNKFYPSEWYFNHPSFFYKKEDVVKAYNKLINTKPNKKFRLVEVTHSYKTIKEVK